MNKPLILCTALLTAVSATAAADALDGAGNAAARAAAAVSQPPNSDYAKFYALDADGDGALGKAEVAGNSELTTRFPALDRNGDGRLSRREFGDRNIDRIGGSR